MSILVQSRFRVPEKQHSEERARESNRGDAQELTKLTRKYFCIAGPEQLHDRAHRHLAPNRGIPKYAQPSCCLRILSSRSRASTDARIV